jgi:hypothetical protein
MRSFYTFCFLFLVTVSLVEGAPKVVTGPERCKSDGTTCALCGMSPTCQLVSKRSL